MITSYFKDTFTGRILESITSVIDDQNRECTQFTFMGTPKKLRIYSTTHATIWVEENEMDKHYEKETHK